MFLIVRSGEPCQTQVGSLSINVTNCPYSYSERSGLEGVQFKHRIVPHCLSFVRHGVSQINSPFSRSPPPNGTLQPRQFWATACNYRPPSIEVVGQKSKKKRTLNSVSPSTPRLRDEVERIQDGMIHRTLWRGKGLVKRQPANWAWNIKRALTSHAQSGGKLGSVSRLRPTNERAAMTVTSLGSEEGPGKGYARAYLVLRAVLYKCPPR